MLETEHTTIDWHYEGKPDALVGTGATRAEQFLVWIAGVIGVALYIYYYLVGSLEWATWQYLLAALLAADVAGGMVANSLNSCKRFYHTAIQENETGLTRRLKNPLFFSGLHIYPLLAGLLFVPTDLSYGLFWYAALQLSTVIVLRTPLYLRRPMAFLIILLTLLLNQYVIKSVPGFEWLIPALFLKIIYGHLVREEPYRPAP